MKTLLTALIAFVSLLISPAASAQSFGNHYDQTTQTLSSGQVVYLSIPRTGWPVHVQLSAIDPSTGSVQAAPTSFTIADGTIGNPMMTVPESTAGQAPTTCGGSNVVGAAVECSVSGSALSVGYMDISSDQPHKMFLSLNGCGCTLQFRVTMWY